MDDDYLVVNGDTFLRYNVQALSDFHANMHSTYSIVSVHIKVPERYGVLQFQDNRITEFFEKKYQNPGWINAGHYMVNSNEFKCALKALGYDKETTFSLEAFLARFVECNNIYGFKVDTDFIDIGVPDDLKFARDSFKW